jgi:hypothetical protein
LAARACAPTSAAAASAVTAQAASASDAREDFNDIDLSFV